MTSVVDDFEEADNAPEDFRAVWTRFSADRFPVVAKMAAVRRAYDACLEYGLPDGYALALAHTAVDPTELRSSLRTPARLHVPGGVVHVIDVDLWVPGVVPMPTNNRTLENRIYPSAGVAGHGAPLSGPEANPGDSSTLVVAAESVEHVLEQSERAANFILRANPLRSSIAGRGILIPIDVVHVELRHRNRTEPISLLAAAEGSSRITNAQSILGLNDPKTTHYDFIEDRDSFRRFINSVADSAAADGLNTRGMLRLRARRNALIVPARVFLSFESAHGSHFDFARAMHGYLGALHVDPPKPWSQTGKLEAMGEAVLRVLRSEQLISHTLHDYLAGYLTPEEARAAELPTARDEQAAFVLAELLRADRQEVVDRGIRDVTAKRSVSHGRRADVIAELALRPTRSAGVAAPETDAARRAERMRAAYLRASRLQLYSTHPWKISSCAPEALCELALQELHTAATGGDISWKARLELAAIAQYHLTAFGALRREALGGTARELDQRAPHEVLRTMLDNEQGLRLLYQAIVDGRAGRAPRAVTATGEVIRGEWNTEDGFVEDITGSDLVLSDLMLRYEFFPREPGARRRRLGPLNETPSMAVSRLKVYVESATDELISLLDELSSHVGPTGRPLLNEQGWHAQPIVHKLSEVQQRLVGWTFVASNIGPHGGSGDESAPTALFNDEENPGEWDDLDESD